MVLKVDRSHVVQKRDDMGGNQYEERLRKIVLEEGIGKDNE